MQRQQELTPTERMIRDLGRLAWAIVLVLTLLEGYLIYLASWQITSGNRDHTITVIPEIVQGMTWVGIMLGLIAGASFAMRAWLIHRDRR